MKDMKTTSAQLQRKGFACILVGTGEMLVGASNLATATSFSRTAVGLFLLAVGIAFIASGFSCLRRARREPEING